MGSWFGGSVRRRDKWPHGSSDRPRHVKVKTKARKRNKAGRATRKQGRR